MNTFLADKNQISQEDVIKIASDCLHQKIDGIAQIGTGANSKVYRLTCPDGQYVAKFYFQHPSDSRDRLGTEFKSFSFLWERGISQVPKPVYLSREHQCAFYEFVKGAPLGRDIVQKDIDTAVAFLEILKNLSPEASLLSFSSASEAFFCGKDIINSLRARLKRFDLDEKAHEYLALREYLYHEFLPLLEIVQTWSKEYLTHHGVSWEQALLEQYRTLSPSDFGFHNALRMRDGSIIFLDFEYFGWDDPAKLVSDFLWHPAMHISEEHKMYFVHQMSRVWGHDPYFKARLKGFFPLFGLKWCLIFLNEFIPTDLQRRAFAQTQIKDKTQVRLEQLMKAKQMSQGVKMMYKDFPYGN